MNGGERGNKNIFELINIKKKNFPPSLTTILARAISLYGDWKGTLIFQDFRRAKASLVGSILICDWRICYCRSRRCRKYAGIIERGGYSTHKILILTEQDYLDVRIYAAEQTAVSAHETAKDRLILLLSGNANCHFKLKPILVHHPQYPTACILRLFY